MKYLLFIKFNSGLMHNSVYGALDEVSESVMQLVEDEALNARKERVPSVCRLKRHLERRDDYFGEFSNGTWYHIQPHLGKIV